MREALRTEHIDRLIEGIILIGSGSAFERCGAKFLDHHLSVKLIHRGLNVQLNPVGGTVDSYDDTGTTAAEYSADKGYFTGAWSKPTNDLLHAVTKHPSVGDIYLLSSQVAPVGRIPAFAQEVQQWPGFFSRNIHLYDARRIAEVIVDEMILHDAATESLVEHLPALSRILNEHKATLAVPSADPLRVSLPAFEADIASRLTDASPILAISGIAGSGKSDAAAAYAAAKRNHYQTRMWVEGSDITKAADLSATRLWRGGAALNVAGMLKSRRCLLVIDDLPPTIALESLKSLCAPGSHILVTRREVESQDLIVPHFDSTEARQILDRDVKPCPQEILELLLSKIGGHPLSLALVNKAVRSGSRWAEIADDVDAIGEFADGRDRLADRLLGRLQGTMGKELAVFAWAGPSGCDHQFLRSVIKSPGMVKIGDQGLLAADRPSTVRLHEVVYASLTVQGLLTSLWSGELDDLLEKYIAELAQEESLSLRILATTMRTKLESMQATADRPAILVALLEIWSPEELDPAAVGDPARRVDALAQLGRAAAYAEVRAVLESIEGLYRYNKISSIANAKDQLKATLPLFERLLALPNLSASSGTAIVHHWGKALSILGDLSAAREKFEQVMASAAPLDATRLQLARLYSRDDALTVQVENLASDVFERAQAPLTVATSVVLGVVESLTRARGDWVNAIYDRYADVIEREIRSAANAGLEQAYGALAAIGRNWAWRHPIRLAKLATDIPIPSAVEADAKTNLAIGEILAQVAKSEYPYDEAVQERALRYFNAVSHPDDFARQKHGQLLVEMGRFAEAIGVLVPIANIETKPFAAYRLSQARLGEGSASEALELINGALALLTTKDERFASAMLAHRYDVRLALGQGEARQDLDEAIARCSDDKYREVLKARRQTPP